jgi:hypothetical protein
MDDAKRRARIISWLAAAYLGALFLPWISSEGFMSSGGGAGGFFWPGWGGGWSLGFADLVLMLPFGIAAALRLEDVWPVVRQVVPELAYGLVFVTAVRIFLPFVRGQYDSPRPAVGACLAVLLALTLAWVARADRLARA